MYNDDFDREDEKEEESLIKDMARKAISKKIKTTSSFNYVILFVVIGIVLLLLLITIISSVSIMFFFNDGDGPSSSGGSNLAYVDINSEDNYWWPIGGSVVEKMDGVEFATGEPTSTYITSYYGPRTYKDENGKERSDFHNGIDIASSGGTDYVIAVASGVIYAVGTGCPENEGSDSTCNDGMGNYVTIQHYNGNYTRYAHLLSGSIKVDVGDTVKQGQIIAIMGNSGSSTGKHLDFKIFVGGYTNPDDPLNHLSVDETRPIPEDSYNDNMIIKMLHSWEGTGPTEGDYYIVYDDGYGTLTVGHGVTLKWQKDKFAKRGIDVSSLSVGSQIERYIVDDIEKEIFENYRNSVLNLLSKNNITLNDFQVDALVMRIYNTGNVGGFPDKYIEYGNTEALYDNYMKNPTTSNGVYSSGLVRRRDAEWNLFHNGVYTFNS